MNFVKKMYYLFRDVRDNADLKRIQRDNPNSDSFQVKPDSWDEYVMVHMSAGDLFTIMMAAFPGLIQHEEAVEDIAALYAKIAAQLSRQGVIEFVEGREVAPRHVDEDRGNEGLGGYI